MQTAVAESKTSGNKTEFGEKDLKANAAIYHGAKRMIDAASTYDNLEDAIATLTQAWTVLESQIQDGGRFTPDRKLGFGSDNASVIAESLLGRRNTVGKTRKSFNELGK